MAMNRLARTVWATLAVNVGVILSGGFVRATGSGAGCGAHWPTCNGEIIPRPERIETVIEFSHRAGTGLALLLVVGLAVWTLRAYPPGHLVRKGALFSLAFILLESLAGAVLVLFQWVAHDASIGRAYFMVVHLVNTFLLLAAITLTGWWASGGRALRLRGQGMLGWAFGLVGAGALVLGVSGAITALGDTLVLSAGISPAESAVVAQLISLRVYHPLIAVVVGGLLMYVVFTANVHKPLPLTRRIGRVLVSLYVLQLILGAFNVVLKAPVWMQIVHLFFADALWIGLVLLAAQTLSAEEPAARQLEPSRPAFQTGR